MTCIIGFTDKKNDCVWIGEDSLGSNGYTKSTNLASKVFKNKTFPDVVMGSTSTFRHIDLLKYSEILFPEIDRYKGTEVDHEYMVKTFIPNLIDLFQRGIRSESEINRGANFLVGAKNKLFEIQSDYSVLVPERFAAVGCGENVAMGSLLTTTRLCPNLTPQEHILAALRSATEYCCGVAGPYILINTKEDKIYKYDN